MGRGALLDRIQRGRRQVLFDAHLPSTYESYRAYRLSWSGQPSDAAGASPSSRSGARRDGLRELERRHRRGLLARARGPLAASARAAGERAASAGFETAIARAEAWRPARYVEVQALDATGAVIGASPATAGLSAAKAGFAGRRAGFLETFERFFGAAFAHGGGVGRGRLRGRGSSRLKPRACGLVQPGRAAGRAAPSASAWSKVSRSSARLERAVPGAVVQLEAPARRGVVVQLVFLRLRGAVRSRRPASRSTSRTSLRACARATTWRGASAAYGSTANSVTVSSVACRTNGRPGAAGSASIAARSARSARWS